MSNQSRLGSLLLNPRFQAVKPAAWSSGGAKSLGQNRGVTGEVTRLGIGIFLWDGQGYHGDVIGTPNHHEILYGEEVMGNLLGTCRYIWRIAGELSSELPMWFEKDDDSTCTHTEACLEYKQDMTETITSKKMWIWPTDVGTTNHPKEWLSSATHIFTNWYGDYQHTLGAKLGNLN